MRRVLSYWAVLFASTCFPAEVPTPADTFVNSVGVNVHLNYTDSLYYANFPLVLQALKDLHVRHVRDGVHDFGSGQSFYYSNHNALAKAGIRTNYAVGLDVAQAVVQSWPSHVTDLESLEATNEADDGRNPNWVNEVKTQLAWLYPIARSLGVPLVGPSLINQQWATRNNSFLLLGDLSHSMDYNNLHNYFAGFAPETRGWGGSDSQGHGYGSIAWNLDQANLDGPGVPVWTTETGYDVNTAHNNSVPPAIYGIYIARMIFAQWNAGIQRTFIYELADDPSTQPSLGLMDHTGARQPAFLALSSLLGLLQDPGPAFTPTAITYALSGNTSNVQHVLLQKRDGSLFLALWIALPVYDTNTKTLLTVSAQSVTVTLPANIGAALLYTCDSNWNYQSSPVRNSGNQVSIPVISSVSLLKLSPTSSFTSF